MPWRVGEVIRWREVERGKPQLVMPVQVVADREDVLALYLAEGTAIGFPREGWPWKGRDPWERRRRPLLGRSVGVMGAGSFLDGSGIAGRLGGLVARHPACAGSSVSRNEMPALIPRVPRHTQDRVSDTQPKVFEPAEMHGKPPPRCTHVTLPSHRQAGV